jgi:hypothetical protein
VSERTSPVPSARHRLLAGLLTFLVVCVATACGSTEAAGPSPSTGAPTTAPATTTTPPTTAPPTTAAPTTVAPTTPPTTAPPTTEAPPPLRTPTPEQPLRTLILGDSTAYEVGNALVRSNTDGLLATEVLFKTSSGVTRPDFFDWPFYLRWVVDENPPELMLLSLGANDAQPIVGPDGTYHQVHDEGWTTEYHRRVDEISRYIAERGVPLYWIGQPYAKSEGYSAGMDVINNVYEQVADEVDGVEFIDIWPALSGPDGEYLKTVDGPDGQPIEIRASDDIHLTEAGGDLAAALVWDVLRADWGE